MSKHFSDFAQTRRRNSAAWQAKSIFHPVNRLQCAGFALIPEDRRKTGLVLIHSVKENAILPMISKLTKHGLVDEKANRVVNENVKELNIRTEGINKRINLLSGGNQQKVVIGKWINVGADVMMLTNRQRALISVRKRKFWIS